MPAGLTDLELQALADAEPTPMPASAIEPSAAALLARFPLSTARLTPALLEQWLVLATNTFRDYPAEIVREAIDGPGALSRSRKWLPSEAELREGLDELKAMWVADRGRARLALAKRHAPEHLQRCELFRWRIQHGLGDSAYATLKVALS